MIALLLLLAATPDHVDAEITAVVEDDLETVSVSVTHRVTSSVARDRVTVVLAADRYQRVEPPLPPAAERSIFPKAVHTGGFERVVVSIDGQLCRPEETLRETFERFLSCPFDVRPGVPYRVDAQATLKVPERFGPFGRIDRHLTLAAGWYPYVATPNGPPARGRHRVRVTIPPYMGAVIGGEVFPPIAEGARTLSATLPSASSVPLLLLAPSVTTRLIGGHIRLVRPAPVRETEARRQAALERALEDALRFWVEAGLPLPDPPLVVTQVPLRHNLARATAHGVLVSDRAFRLFPMERFYHFHRHPVLREVFTALMLRTRGNVEADAIGAWLLDRYVASRTGRAEDAFDLLQFWSFIPAIDSLLYAPQLPFVGAYFRLIEEADPLRPNIIDYPDPQPRGKILYEKLLDRLRPPATHALFEAALEGTLDREIDRVLGAEAASFRATWLGPYPDVRYRLAEYGSKPCGDVHCATVQIERSGDAVAEPVQVLLEDDDGNERMVWSDTTAAADRTVTATLAAPLSYVKIDPLGRIAERPSAEVPSPKFDNASSARWRVLLNNLNVLLAASAGQINTSIDLGFSRVRDVHWRFGLNGGFSPAAISLSGRATRYFGPTVTPDRLSHWIGATVSGDYLRSDFTDAAEPGFALSGALYYGYDDRKTVWAPEAGTALRLTLDYTHVFGEAGDPTVTADAVALTARALHSIRLAAAHQISFRATAGAYLAGQPREQLLYFLGGRRNLRGYDVGERQGRIRGIASVEWVHALVGNANDDFLEIVYMTAIDGALFGDVAVIADSFSEVTEGPVFADLGYGLRFTIDYFGARPGIMAIDFAFPLVNTDGRFELMPPAVYIDFTQSFLIF